MKDNQARALAITALVFMGIFLAALVATLVDHTLLNGAVGYVALGAGVFVLMTLIALKADGRGFSMTKLNNEIEMEKLERERRESEEKAAAENETTDENDGASEVETTVEEEPSDEA